MKNVFPRGGAWLSAIALLVFTGTLSTVMRWCYGASFSLWWSTPRLGALVGLLGVLSPILLIAFGNHFMHLVLDKLAKRASPRGAMPGLMSWWAGLYGWLVLMLATWTSLFLVLVIHPQSTLSGFFSLFSYDASLASVISVPTIVWFFMAAILFQVERRVRDKMAAGPDSTT